ncbi:MAG: hypothetical protein LAT68_10605 [Cyclobacteriaceae bacterium]|nr:hypothetical protein [Cyclobacteriaceae bacterium]MCH8516766.1 hypothetical protein [Cyclobacteriaceae bacterium]
MVRISRGLWNLSMLLFLAIFLYAYSFLPDRVAISVDTEGVKDTFITKDQFFYFGIGAFVISNLLFAAMANIVQSSAIRANSFLHSEEFRDQVYSWLISFNFAMNMFFASIGAYLSFFNNSEYLPGKSYGYITYFGIAFVLIWLLLLAWLFVNRISGFKTAETEN